MGGKSTVEGNGGAAVAGCPELPLALSARRGREVAAAVDAEAGVLDDVDAGGGEAGGGCVVAGTISDEQVSSTFILLRSCIVRMVPLAVPGAEVKPG